MLKQLDSDRSLASIDLPLAQRSAKAALWLFARRVLSSLIRLAAVAVLARRLNPADFGLVALANVLLQFLMLIATAGVGTYVIFDRTDGREGRVHSAFWLNLALTCAQLGVGVVALPLVVSLYPEPELPAILGAFAGIFFFRQMAVVPEALVQREMGFEKLALRDLVTDLASAVLSVVLALRGWGVWSLVLPQLVIEPCRLVGAFLFAQWLPQARMKLKEWRVIGRYSMHVMGSNLLGVVLNDGDTMLVGKLLGTQPLGYYNLAWQLANFVGRNVSGIVSVVAMPLLSSMNYDHQRLGATYRRITRLLATATFPLLCGLYVLANEVVSVLYGARWDGIVPLLRTFVLFTMVRSVTSSCSIVFNAVGRPEIGLKFNVALVPFYLAAVLTGTLWGVLGVAVGVTVVRFVGGLAAHALALRVVGSPVLESLRELLVPLGMALIMAGGVWIAQRGLALGGVEQGPMRAALAFGAGLLTYAWMVCMVRPPVVKDLRSLMMAIAPRLRARFT